MATPSETKRPDLNLLAMEVHANAVRHGWWESNPSDEHCFALVVCELAEAIEADRKGNYADKACFEIMMREWEEEAERESDPQQYQYELKSTFELEIKDTTADELADTVIRLLDMAGAHGYDLLRCGAIVGCIHNSRAFTENVWEIVQVLTDRRMSVKERIVSGIVAVEILATAYNIDLWWHVLVKMRYNHSRPYKHGKKY